MTRDVSDSWWSLACISALLIGLSGGCSTRSDVRVSDPDRPANPNASIEAIELLHRLRDFRGQGLLVGQHNNPEAPDSFSNYANISTGQRPAIWGNDFKYGWRTAHRAGMIEEAIRQWESGSIVTLMYHAPLPTDPIDGDWESVGGELTPEEWDSLLTPGTILHGAWLEHIDAVAEGLKVLRDAGVPVLWRPYHEMNATHFWWGQKPGGGHRSIWRRIYPHVPHLVDPLTDLLKWLKGNQGRGATVVGAGLGPMNDGSRTSTTEKDGFRTLWRMMFERYTYHHELDNLLWVWSVSPPSDLVDPLEPYWPGEGYVDVVGLDWWSEMPVSNEAYEAVRSIADGKPLMLTEVGGLPDAAVMRASQPDWMGVVVYMHHVMELPEDHLAAFYAHPEVVTLDAWIRSDTLGSRRESSVMRQMEGR